MSLLALILQYSSCSGREKIATGSKSGGIKVLQQAAKADRRATDPRAFLDSQHSDSASWLFGLAECHAVRDNGREMRVARC